MDLIFNLKPVEDIKRWGVYYLYPTADGSRVLFMFIIIEIIIHYFKVSTMYHSIVKHTI